MTKTATKSLKAEKPQRTKAKTELTIKPARQPRPTEAKKPRVTVGERLEKMLRRQDGVSLAEMMEEFGILAHSARAVISVEKRKRGLEVTLEDGRYRVA